jgi:hypothetical protein
MKQFTCVKIGYTAGVYGCSNEYFNFIIDDIDEKGRDRHHWFYLKGLYGADDRIINLLKEKGYKETFTSSWYGKLTRSTAPKHAKTEDQAINYINNNFKDEK